MNNIRLNRITVVLRQTAIFFDRWHWVLLALAAPFLLFISPGRSLVLFVVPGLWLVAWLAGREPLPRTPLNAALLLMFFMVLVSLWATYDVVVSLPKISGIVLGLGIFHAFSREGQTPRGWWLGFLLFLGIGFGIAAVGLLGTQWDTKITLLTPIVSRLALRVTGLPGAEEGFHPNYVAGALLWVIPSFLTFSWLLLTRAKDVRGLFGRGKTNAVIVLTIGATLWTMAIFILTQSRGGYIALALTLPVLILIALPPRWRWYSLAILALLAIVLGILLASHWEAVRIWFTGSNLAAGPTFSLNSLEGRLELWSRAIYGIQDFPLTGMGMNAFRKVVPVLYPLFQVGPDTDIGHAHNEFLQAALDLGIPGLIAFIGLNIGAFWMLIRTWQSTRLNTQSAPSDRRTAVHLTKPGGWFSVLGTSPFADVRLVQMAVLGLGGGLLAHMLWGLTDAMALGARPAFSFWIILGLISGLHQQARNCSNDFSRSAKTATKVVTTSLFIKY
ncbi:MAG: O-antigen ligase family protein [Candidatus Atribacteria bacterium]|nr:O-antigen ligase family protein [Candidatus Atribacteria bacterium]